MGFKATGYAGGLKGHVFDPEDQDSIPSHITKLQAVNPVRAVRELKALQERYKVVEKCKECDEPLIAEEIPSHYMSFHVSDEARSLVRMMANVEPDVRKEVIAFTRKYLNA